MAAERVRSSARAVKLIRMIGNRSPLALRLLPFWVARLFSPSHAPDFLKHVEAEMMTNLRRTLLAAAMIGIVSAGTFAQKNGNDNKRPPKDPPKVVVKDKGKPPPSSTQDKKKGKP
jgi:hypothetical protein